MNRDPYVLNLKSWVYAIDHLQHLDPLSFWRKLLRYAFPQRSFKKLSDIADAARRIIKENEHLPNADLQISGIALFDRIDQINDKQCLELCRDLMRGYDDTYYFQTLSTIGYDVEADRCFVTEKLLEINSTLRRTKNRLKISILKECKAYLCFQLKCLSDPKLKQRYARGKCYVVTHPSLMSTFKNDFCWFKEQARLHSLDYINFPLQWCEFLYTGEFKLAFRKWQETHDLDLV